MKPRTIGAGLFFATGLGIFVACIPHPKEDYDEFLERTGDARAPLPKEDVGPVDSTAPTEAIEGLYYGSCLSSLSLGDLNKVLRFYTEVRFVPGTSGGKLDITFSPLKGVDLSSGNPVPVPPDSVSRGQVRGDSFGAKESPVTGQGRFRVVFPKAVIDKDANPISGRPIEIENVAFEGVFSAGASGPSDGGGPGADAQGTDAESDGGEAGATADAGAPPVIPGGRSRFCATLGGYVTQPIRQPLDSTTDFCVFVPVKEGDKEIGRASCRERVCSTV